MTDAPRFEMRGVRKSFGSTRALDGVDFTVAAGEICALVGQNGAGKSTLMSILSGAAAADAGAMRIDGEPYEPRSPVDGRRCGVAMIYQGLSLAPDLSVMENISLGAEPLRWGLVDRARMRRQAEQALADLGHGEIAAEARVASLGPAGQQLVEVARALASGCRVLVLDEPTSSLGHTDVQRLFEILGRLRQQGMAIVYISHFIEEVQAISDRFVVLRDGRVAGEGTTRNTEASSIVATMVGGAVDEFYPRGDRVARDVVLELDALVPGHATLALRRGEVVGIAGLVGAGRTRLLRAIFGLEPVKSGRVRIGTFSGPASPAARWQQGVGMVSEDRGAEGLALDLSIADNLTLSTLDRPGSGFFVKPSALAAQTDVWLERLDVRSEGPWRPMRALSGGNQQKIALARLLHHDVDVLLLDEPSRGIDVGSKARIYRLIDEAVSDRTRPRAALLVSSYFPELIGVCDRIAVMTRGRLGETRPAARWTEHDLLMAASGAQPDVAGPSA